MFKKLSFIALCLSLIFLSACVSKNKYVELETKSNQTQAQLELDKENLQAQISKLNNENNRLLDTVEGLNLILQKLRLGRNDLASPRTQRA